MLEQDAQKARRSRYKLQMFSMTCRPPQTSESVHERLRIGRYWAEEEPLCPHQLQSDEVSKRECTKRVWCNDLSVVFGVIFKYMHTMAHIHPQSSTHIRKFQICV